MNTTTIKTLKTTTSIQTPTGKKPSWLSRRHGLDIALTLILLIGTAIAFTKYHTAMDIYEKTILLLSVPTLITLAWWWRPIAWLAIIVGGLSLTSIFFYQGDLERADSVFLLKYFLSSQTAILWMGVCFFVANGVYLLGLLFKKYRYRLYKIGTKLTWGGIVFALVATMVRWYESHQLGPDIGYIPVSNLYEVFILFAWMTALFYLYFEEKYKTRHLGAFVIGIISISVAFLFWYSITRDAHTIQPLVPALKSWWMKLHVPANFVGYGTFALAAMVGIAYLLKQRFPNGVLATLPSLELLDDLMYKAIAIGFAFFTVATVLGALWAAEAWGGYWSWDPKETWALVVWLNYAAWLHLRLMKGLRGTVAAWWAVIGLLITTFAFLGVNIFLSGLHSYGTL
jgi:cytochrome c-type biogenesis protein CcsB